MLRLLSVRHFVLVEALDLELEPGFCVLTGETGAGKSILLDALGLLLGDRFEVRQIRPGAPRAELAAVFDVADAPGVREWLDQSELAGDDADVLVRRVLDAQGRSRAFINGHPVTLAQLTALGEQMVDLHGQHEHQSLEVAQVQRALVDAYGGLARLGREVADAWRAWRLALERSAAAAAVAQATASEREYVAQRLDELAALAVSGMEWAELTASQSRMANASALIDAAAWGEAMLAEGDDALTLRLGQFTHRLSQAATHDPTLAEVLALVEPARIQLDEAARSLRDYRRRLDLDPAELTRVEARLAAIHDVARKYRTRPEALPGLLADTQSRLDELSASADVQALARAAADGEATYRSLALQLSAGRKSAAAELARHVTATLQELAMTGGRLEIALPPLAEGASYGLEQVEFQVATHPKQPLGPLAKVASGGELSRIALAIQVVTSELAQRPTLVFDEVDAGIGGAVAATVGKLLQTLGGRAQVLCVTHLPQVAAFADTHYRVSKSADERTLASAVEKIEGNARTAELARMLGGSEITPKTRAHAKELYEQHRRERSSQPRPAGRR